LLLNAADSQQTFVMPAPPADSPWLRRFDTASADTEVLSLEGELVFPLAPNSAVLLEC
jgi:hypothetical protein